MKDFEKRFNHLVVFKLAKLEDFVNQIALEQARLLERYMWSDKEKRTYDISNLFLKP